MPGPTSILVRCPNWLGDLMMATTFLRRLLKLYPQARIDLLVKSGLENLPLPHRGEILGFDKKSQSITQVAQLLSERGYQRIYVLPPSLSAAALAFMARIPERYGLTGHFGRGLFLNRKIKNPLPERSRHLAEEYHLLFEGQAGVKPGLPGLLIPAGWADGLLSGPLNLTPGFIAFAPGAIYGPAKRWPLEYWQELAYRLSKAGERVIFLGMEGDFTLEAPQAQNLTGQTSLLELVALLSRAKLLVSNDSGAMHIMATLKKPQVAIFGSTSTLWTSPINPQARLVSLHLDCAPCFKRECRYGHYHCLNGIEAEMVLEAVNDALGRPAEPYTAD